MGTSEFELKKRLIVECLGPYIRMERKCYLMYKYNDVIQEILPMLNE